MQYDQVFPFTEPSILFLRNFILDREVEDSSSISLSQTMFDELAVSYRKEYNEPLKTPFLFLGVWVRIDARSTLKREQAGITFNDAPEIVMEAEIVRAPVYRCGYCGLVVGEKGNELNGIPYEDAIARWKRFGDDLLVPVPGECCREKHEEVTNRRENNKKNAEVMSDETK